jgi:cation diffusion facilitator CzcD-associated flavoprotein CzcO
MMSNATNVPKASEIDIPALKEKYRQERDKRLRAEGQGQYVRVDSVLAGFYDEDPHTPVAPRTPISEDIEVAVLGAGWSGILAAYHLRKAGIHDVRNIDLAGDFGGCWYWNRYPGIQCDNEAYCYMALLEETGYIPSKRFADGSEIYEHFQRIARQFGLYENALFHTRIESLRWDEQISRWRIATNRGDDIRARFVVMGAGPTNTPKLPGIPGIADFEGKMFHSSRWDYEYTGGNNKQPVLDKLADKRVAILGTGASSVQAVPYLARYASELYVIQRTPSSVDVRNNLPTDPEWAESLTPGWHARRRDNYQRFTHSGFQQGEVDIVGDIWTEINRNISAELSADGWREIDIEEFLDRRETMDYQVMERLRRRVEDMVEDPDTAEALKPYYRIICKRPTSNDEYYKAFNRPNVHLIDVSGTRGLERLTRKGFVHDGAEYDVDCFIFASGFEVTSELRRRWGIAFIEGRGGRSLYDHWADDYRTLHGATTHGFPNLFFTGLLQGGLNVSLPLVFEQQGEHIAWLIRETLARGALAIEPSQQAQDDWVRDIKASNIDMGPIVRECTPGYYNNEGEEKVRWFLGDSWGPGWRPFLELLNTWRNEGSLPGMVLHAEQKTEA